MLLPVLDSDYMLKTFSHKVSEFRLRRVEDLNLCGLSPTRFRSERHKPLGQPSKLCAPTENRTQINGSANRYSIR